MTRGEDRHERHARGHLESLGYSVVRIDPPARDGEESADLLCRAPGECLLVEVKGRDPSAAAEDLLSNATACGTATTSRMLARRNRLDGLVCKAAAQLATSARVLGQDIPRVVWITSLGFDADFTFSEFHQTLYGLQTLALYRDDGAFVESRDCFYYHASSLHATRTVDAVVLAGERIGSLCLNEFAKRSAIVRDSQLGRWYCGNGMVDPRELEEAGRVLSLRSPTLLRAPRAKWEYLRARYGYSTAPMITSEWTGLLSITQVANDEPS